MRSRILSLFLVLAGIAVFSGSALAQQKFIAHLNSAQEVPTNVSAGIGTCVVTLNAAGNSISVSCTYSGLTSNLQADHIHGNAAPGVNAGVLFGFGATGGTSGSFSAGPFAVTPTQVANMRAHLFYVNMHTVNFGGGEIRGQLKQANTVFDSDGDGRTDISVFRQSVNTFYTLRSLTNTLESNVFGSGAGDNWLNNTCDFDGDGRGDALLIELDAAGKAYWTIVQSGTNTIRNVQWGDFAAGVLDTLAIGDYDGDGRQDIAVQGCGDNPNLFQDSSEQITLGNYGQNGSGTHCIQSRCSPTQYGFAHLEKCPERKDSQNGCFRCQELSG